MQYSIVQYHCVCCAFELCPIDGAPRTWVIVRVRCDLIRSFVLHHVSTLDLCVPQGADAIACAPSPTNDNIIKERQSVVVVVPTVPIM
jgi:hypothetical protein